MKGESETHSRLLRADNLPHPPPRPPLPIQCLVKLTAICIGAVPRLGLDEDLDGLILHVRGLTTFDDCDPTQKEEAYFASSFYDLIA